MGGQYDMFLGIASISECVVIMVIRSNGSDVVPR